MKVMSFIIQIYSFIYVHVMNHSIGTKVKIEKKNSTRWYKKLCFPHYVSCYIVSCGLVCPKRSFNSKYGDFNTVRYGFGSFGFTSACPSAWQYATYGKHSYLSLEGPSILCKTSLINWRLCSSLFWLEFQLSSRFPHFSYPKNPRMHQVKALSKREWASSADCYI
jgi:hypothetical protein